MLLGDIGGMYLYDWEKGCDYKVNNYIYFIKFEVNRFNIVSFNSCEIEKFMFLGIIENNAFIMVE